MFHREGKKSTPKKTKPLKDLIALESPQKLLAESKRAELVKKIVQSSALEPSRFESIGLTLLHHVAEHCQNLPETANYYGGGLLDFILNRTEAALHLFRQFLVQDEEAEPSEEQKLWLYALFSAALLQGIGKLQVDYRIDLYDENGQLLTQWKPLLERPTAVGHYYHYEFLKHTDEDVRVRITLLLARQLMPESGFAWITSNPQVLAVWLALLNEDLDGAGTLGAILDRAKALAVQRSLFSGRGRVAAIPGGNAPRTSRVSTFIDTSPPGSTAEKERAVGIEFIKWLTEALASGKILVNKIPLFIAVPGGMLMSLKLLEMYVEAHPHKNMQAVQQGFLSLGLHRAGADGKLLSRFEQANKEQMLSGIVVSHAVLPDNVKLFDAKTKAVTSVSAIELIHMAKSSQFQSQPIAAKVTALQHLSASGQWGQAENKAPSIKSGMTQRV